MASIGILGGSFNPIHLGHLLIGRAAAEAFALDRVLLLPCSCSPFKIGAKDMASDTDRLEMVHLSIANDPLFEVSTLDLERGGISYAVDSVRALKSLYPENEYSFIIGMDALSGLPQWREIDVMLSLCEIITLERPGEPSRDQMLETLPFSKSVTKRLRNRIIRGPRSELSSSEIRRRIAQGKSIRYLVCPEVEGYIQRRRLYSN